ncbi:MAG TPA: patatin-like phospholipase family protein [Candidatus Sulfotelmatobacter sp.]|nr:patatin-like phospholipase family protein [Candidatus Sulfotelmatobacter sp.]
MEFKGRRVAVAAALIFFIVLSILAQGQDAAPAEPSKHRPQIGLALSGGGALGLVEVGVIQWMEENHIPVDRIAGTSMGGIIGAMYATGMTAAEIKGFAEKINWEEVLQPDPGYSQLSFRRKQDRRNFLINAHLGLKHGLAGPNGLNPGQGVGLLLDRIAFPESGISNFDDLPIPFRCVATDMQSGETVVLRDGPLAQAVRASMAIPGVFTPVQFKGRTLADGGMVQNIPVETARGMGADVVIAIELRLPPGDITQLGSLTGVLSRAIDVMITQNERLSLALADAKVSVDMKGYWITDYNKVDQLIGLGYKTAASQSADLLRYAIQDPNEWRQYLDARAARKQAPIDRVDTIVVTGADSRTDHSIQQRLSNDLHKPLDLHAVETQLTRIAGQGRFDDLGYEGFTQNGVPGLRVTAHEKSYGPPFVDLAVNVVGSGVAAFDFSAGARVTFMDTAHHGGEWRNDLLFGSSNLAATEYYQPVGQSGLFVAPYAFASKYGRNSFSGLTRVAIFGDERAGGGLDIGYDSGRRSEFRFGYELFDGKLVPLVGATGLPIVHGTTGQFRARYVWDGQDSPSVPSKGSLVVVTLSRVLQSPNLPHPLDQLEVQTSNFIPLGQKTSLFSDVSGGTTFRGSAGPLQVFQLGGPFRLGAYFPNEFLGNHYAYASFGFRREIYRLPQLVGRKIYWGGWYEAGTAFGVLGNDPGPVVVRGTFNLGVIADTIVGPIAVAGSVSPTGQSRVNFSIGRLF